MKASKTLLFICLFVSTILLKAQTNADTSLVRIETRDGNEYVGQITKEDTDKITLSTQRLGEISILKTDIKSQKAVQPQQIKDGKVWFPNPQASRYFWSPNGYGLKKGEGYYQNIWVLWNQFAYGITDNFSIGGAVVPLFLFGGGPTPVFISPKISFPVEKEKFNLGAGALMGTVLGETEGAFGLVYGISTFGPPDRNISIGLGYGFADGEWASSPIVNISGMFRLSPRWYFISENYYIGVSEEGGGIISGGARWIIKKAALDFGLFVPFGSGIDFVAIPWLGFSIPFGNSQ